MKRFRDSAHYLHMKRLNGFHRFSLAVALLAFAAAAHGQGVILPNCLPRDEVIFTNHPKIALSELTNPSRGRNVPRQSPEDRITAVVEPTPGSAHIEIRLVTSIGVDYWKGVEVVQGQTGRPTCFLPEPGTSMFMAETQGDRRRAITSIHKDLAAECTLVFWKGKVFNVHTPMYQLSGNLGSLIGHRITIYWEVD